MSLFQLLPPNGFTAAEERTYHQHIQKLCFIASKNLVSDSIATGLMGEE